MADGPLAEAVTRRLAGRVELVPWETTVSQPRVEAIYTYGHPLLDRERLALFPHVRVISNYGVGVDHIEVAAAASRGIPVGNTPGILDGATADMAFALLLAAARRIVVGDRYARSPAFTVYDPGYMLGREVHGATIGIVGLGRIGWQIAQRARGFNMQVLYHNRRRRDDDGRLPARHVSFEDLLRTADYVVISTPLTAETRGLMGAAQFALMKPTSILVNISRGPVVDTAALTAALAARQIEGAALDVTDPEPLPRDHPLLQLDNLTLAPHLGSATVETRELMAEISVENLLLGLSGQPLRHAVRG